MGRNKTQNHILQNTHWKQLNMLPQNHATLNSDIILDFIFILINFFFPLYVFFTNENILVILVNFVL